MRNLALEAALGAPEDQVGSRLLALPEGQWFERKSIRIARRDLAPPLVALANAEGGTIVVGLGAGKVEGIAGQENKVNDLRQVPIDFTSPPVRARFVTVACRNSDGGADHLLIIQVEPGELVHETADGSCYLRVGDETRKLGYQMRRELEFDRGQGQYDGHPCGALRAGALNKELLEQYRRQTGAESVERLLPARSLVTTEGIATNAACLLFADHPQAHFPQAYVRVIRFLDLDRGTGARLALDEGSDIRIEGPLPRQIDEAAATIERLLPRRRALAASGRFEALPIVPRDAWLEGVVNAVIHRSYSLAGDHIRVEVYPDRIEIESPGRFPGLSDPRTPLQISRFARNPRIARACADLRIGQELGEGIKRMFDEMRGYGLADPVYRQGSGSVRLVLTGAPRIDPLVAERLPAGSHQVLEILRSANAPLSTGELAEALGRSRPHTLIRVRALQAEGLIRWVGTSATDPRATWELA